MEVNRTFWRKLNKEFGDTFQKKLLNEASYRAVRFSKQRFIQKNWIDTTPKPWQPRKRKDSGKLMVKSGRLKRSIREISRTAASITIGTDVPYARIHNEGGIVRETVQIKAHTRKRSARQRRGSGDIKVKAHSRQMNVRIPPRPFIGESKALFDKIEKKMNTLTERTLNRL
ncbi:hypothetical protein GO491_07640 [Flavobacteriaceae bacterium Ap0902]|nr:hypothetical protein [Flavobacteriaceae bacterium Ap0902]